MSKAEKTLKGYIKTESVILLVIMALAIGFVAGVVFSAYRSSQTQMTSFDSSVPQLTPQQQETLKALEERTQTNPRDVDAWTHLGHLYFDSGQPDKAIEAYETSLQLDAGRPDVWTDLGVMYRRTGKPEKSIECFDNALARNPNHQIALYNKGIVLMHDLKDPNGALSVWQTLVKIHPEATTPAGEPLMEIIQQLKQTVDKQQNGSQGQRQQ